MLHCQLFCYCKGFCLIIVFLAFFCGLRSFIHRLIAARCVFRSTMSLDVTFSVAGLKAWNRSLVEVYLVTDFQLTSLKLQLKI